MSRKPTDFSKWPVLEIKCLNCEEVKPIPQKLKHRTNVCLDCQRAKQREYNRLEAIREGRRVGSAGRIPYPLGEYDYYQQKFYERKRELDKSDNRQEWIQILKRNLKETEENEELMNWINGHEDDEIAKPKSKINKDYPDTRNMTWEEWERLGYGTEEDD